MAKQSAGLVMFRVRDDVLQFLLVHPGGPFWRSKDKAAWSIPKGELGEGEDLLEAARREFEEELGIVAHGPFYPLGSIMQKAGKVVHVWAFKGDYDTTCVWCNTVEIEWPPRSGMKITFPEIDRAEFLSSREAVAKINPAQLELLERAEQRLQIVCSRFAGCGRDPC